MKYIKEELEKLILQDKLSYREIGRRYQVSDTFIKRKARKLGIKLPIRSVFPESFTPFNKGMVKTESKIKPTIINKQRVCANCQTILYNHHAICCSLKCSHQLKWKEIKIQIEQGISTLYFKRYKRFLIEKYGEKCMCCGWNERNSITGNVPIELEHIDGNSDNNNINNLKLLCPNCHSLTATYKALNVGNGRYKRKERYRKGKSF